MRPGYPAESEAADAARLRNTDRWVLYYFQGNVRTLQFRSQVCGYFPATAFCFCRPPTTASRKAHIVDVVSIPLAEQCFPANLRQSICIQITLHSQVLLDHLNFFDKTLSLCVILSPGFWWSNSMSNFHMIGVDWCTPNWGSSRTGVMFLEFVLACKCLQPCFCKRGSQLVHNKQQKLCTLSL